MRLPDGPQRNQLWVTEIGLSFHQSIMWVLWSGVFFSPDKDLSTLGAFFQLMIMAGFPTNTANKKDNRQRQLLKLLLLKSNLQLTLALSTSTIQWCYLSISPTSVSKVLNPRDHRASLSSLARQNVQHTPQTCFLSPLTPRLLRLPLLDMYERERVIGGCHGISVCFFLSFTVSLIVLFFFGQTKSYFYVVPS